MANSVPALPTPANPPEPASFFKKLMGHLARIPFARDLLAVYYCALDPATPARARATLFGAIAYFMMPADAIPDAILLMGFTDDAAVIALVIRVLGSHIQQRHYERAQTRLAELTLN